MNLLAVPSLVITAIGVAVGLGAAVVGVIQYADAVKLRRANWLYKLYQEFYVKKNLKEIREKLDSDSGRKEIESLVSKSENSLSETESTTLASFTDYLNFFEFMVYLKKKGAIKREDMIDMFKYYLDCLRRSAPILSYIPKFGFEMLNEFFGRDGWWRLN